MRHRTISTFFILSFVFLFISPLLVFADDILIGQAAPFFKVLSGDKKAVTLDDIRGKVAVLFYESKNAIEQNRKLKNALNLFYARQPESLKRDIVRIGVIDCKGVLFRGAWEAALRDHSLKEGITIYGDWDGKMLVDYHAAQDMSNLIIIDKKGIIRYCITGCVEDSNISVIEVLLSTLVEEKY